MNHASVSTVPRVIADAGLEFLENLPFTDIRCGDTASLVRVISAQDVQLFAAVSGNVNPTHVDAGFAATQASHGVVAHAMLGASLISTLLGTRLPGPGTIYLSQTLEFSEPVLVDDTLTVTVTVMSIDPAKHIVLLLTRCINQRGEVVLHGQAQVLAPADKRRVRRLDPVEPTLVVHGRRRYGELLEAASKFSRIRMGVLDPTGAIGLSAALEAARLGLIDAILIGAEAGIRSMAGESGIDLDGVTIVDTGSASALHRGVAMVVAGDVDALSVDRDERSELLLQLSRACDASTAPRSISHVAVLDVPRFAQPLFVTDAETQPMPDVPAKVAIIENAMLLARAVGIARPKIALLSSFDHETRDCASSGDATTLMERFDNGSFPGAVLKGPMTLARALAGCDAPAGSGAVPECFVPDILVVPDRESGRMLIDSLMQVGAARGTSLVIGAQVPIVLTAATDAEQARIAGCAMALLFLKHQRHHLKRTATGLRPGATDSVDGQPPSSA